MTAVNSANQTPADDSTGSNERPGASAALHRLAVALGAQLDPLGEGEVPWKPEGCALVLLASPEMQSIKAHILHVTNVFCNTTAESFLQGSDLPQSVIDWVLS